MSVGSTPSTEAALIQSQMSSTPTVTLQDRAEKEIHSYMSDIYSQNPDLNAKSHALVSRIWEFPGVVPGFSEQLSIQDDVSGFGQSVAVQSQRLKSSGDSEALSKLENHIASVTNLWGDSLKAHVDELGRDNFKPSESDFNPLKRLESKT